MSDKKKKNEDFYVIEDQPQKPKRKPKPSTGLSRRFVLVGILIALLVVAAGVELFILLVPTNRVVVVAPSLPPALFPLPTVTWTPLPSLVPSRPPLPTLARTSTPSPTLPPLLQPTTIAEHVYSLSWSPDGKTLAVTTNTDVRLYNAEFLNQPPRVVTGFAGAVSNATFSPDGKVLAIVSHAYPDKGYTWGDPLKIADITLWDTATGQMRVLKGHTNFIHTIRFSRDGTRLISGSMDKTVLIWDTRTGKVLSKLISNLNYFNDVVFDPQGLLLAAGSNEEQIPHGFRHFLEQWNLNLGETEAFTPSTYDVTVYSMAFDRQGKLLATSLEEGVWIQDLTTIGPVKKLLGVPPTSLMVFSPDSTLLAIGLEQQLEGMMGSGGGVQVWDFATAQARFSLENTTGRINAIAFSTDGTKIAFGTDDGKVQIREVSTGRLISDLRI